MKTCLILFQEVEGLQTFFIIYAHNLYIKSESGEVSVMAEKRKIEVFTAGCQLCDETVKMVTDLICPSCDLTVYDLKKDGMDKAKEYGVNSVPTVVVNGRMLDCCTRGKPTKEDLKAAGIGAPI